MKLWHVSDDPRIRVFEPRAVEAHDSPEALVWAIDDERVPVYWFPRECPRGSWWATDATTDEDVERFLSGDRARRVHAIQWDWLEAVRTARVYAYVLPADTFEPYGQAAGYHVSRKRVEPVEMHELNDLLALHAEAGIELRIVASLAEEWTRVIASSVEFSGIRLRNLATPA